MKNSFLLIASYFVIQLNGCSTIFWRTVELDPIIVNSNHYKFEYQVTYLEKDSWNPMSGTSIKKSYKTKLSLIQPDGIRIELPKLNSWILPGNLIYNDASDQLFWIQGVDDEFGTMKRKAGIATGMKDNLLKEIKFWGGEPELVHLSPSPKGNSVAYVYQKTNQSGNIEYFLAIWYHGTEITPKSIHPIPFWDVSPGKLNYQYDLNWKDNSILKVNLNKQTLTWKDGKIL